MLKNCGYFLIPVPPETVKYQNSCRYLPAFQRKGPAVFLVSLCGVVVVMAHRPVFLRLCSLSFSHPLSNVTINFNSIRKSSKVKITRKWEFSWALLVCVSTREMVFCDTCSGYSYHVRDKCL